MRRTLITVALATCSLVAMGGNAMAQDPPVVPTPPEFAPPAPAPVTDPASAGVFAKLYVAQHARDFLRQRDRRRVRVTDVDASCLQSPFLDTRFGCVFTLKALVISRNRGWDNWGHGDSRGHNRARVADDHGHGKKGHDRDRHRFRVRRYGCLGALTIDAGPPPVVRVRFVECARIHGGRDDITVEEPTVAPA